MIRPILLIIYISTCFYTLDGATRRLMASLHSSIFSEDAERLPAQEDVPKIEIKFPGAPKDLTWDTQIRYAINVSDPKDGESQYGEIDARACLVQIEYFPRQKDFDELIKRSTEEPEHAGLSLMKRSTCFGCHADKTRLAGPSFEEISARYKGKNNPDIATGLGRHIVEGSSGIWDSQIMPSHPDLSLAEATQIADYILEQGGRKHRWIYSGLEGTFKTREKPEDHDQGVYVLTASYTSTSNVRGLQSIILSIK